MSLARRRSNSASTSPRRWGGAKPTTSSWTGPSGIAGPRRSVAQDLALRQPELLGREDAVVVERLQVLELLDDVAPGRRRGLGGARPPLCLQLLPPGLV